MIIDTYGTYRMMIFNYFCAKRFYYENPDYGTYWYGIANL